MMPVRQKRKKKPPVAKHFGVSERTVRNHMAEERTPTKPSRLPGAIWPGPCGAQGKTWAEIAAAVGGSEWSARARW
jgi:hypothetical protein